MSSLLRLRIEANWPSQETRCEWALYDLRGELLQRGQSDPQHWPASEECEVVLSADQCVVLDARLPKGVKTNDSKLVGYLIEDRLIGDIQNEHIVAGDRDAEGAARIWVVSRARLTGLIEALRQLGRKPRRAFCELQLAPLANEAWSVCLQDARGFARTAAEAGFAFDLSGSDPPPELMLAVQAAREQDNLPRRIDVYSSQDANIDNAAWQTLIGVPVQRAGESAWDAWPTRSARNLLVGEFTPPQARHSGWAPFKPALAIGAASLVLYTLFSLGEWTWLNQRAGSLRQQMTEVFSQTFPNVQTIVDPSLQMQRLYEQQMSERGRLGESDFLPLLAVVSDSLPGQTPYRSLAYEEGRLEFTVLLRNARAGDQLREALSRRGLTPTLRESRQTRAGIETSLSVRFGT